MIEARELTKRYGDTTAVQSLSFTIAPGTVTGFLGPNGAGKSTTMRMIMGLDRPTSGIVTVNGKPDRQHRAPLREVGALLEDKRRAPRPQRPLTPALHGRPPQHQGLPGQRGQSTPSPAATPADGPLLSKEEPMTIPTKTPNLLDNPPVIRPQRRSKR